MRGFSRSRPPVRTGSGTSWIASSKIDPSCSNVDLSFSAAEEAFRAELRAWLKAHLPAGWSGEPPAAATLAAEVAFLRAWQRQLADGGWVGIHWPREYGGRGATVVENYIFQEEM